MKSFSSMDSRHRLLRLVPFLCAAALLSCRSATESVPWSRDVGTLYDSPDSTAALTLPARARVGEPVTITVTTGGSGNCTRPSGATVQVVGLVATVLPLDERPEAAVACSRDLRPYPRSVDLTFRHAGQAQIVVIGLRPGPSAGLVSVTGTLAVEP